MFVRYDIFPIKSSYGFLMSPIWYWNKCSEWVNDSINCWSPHHCRFDICHHHQIEHHPKYLKPSTNETIKLSLVTQENWNTSSEYGLVVVLLLAFLIAWYFSSSELEVKRAIIHPSIVWPWYSLPCGDGLTYAVIIRLSWQRPTARGHIIYYDSHFMTPAWLLLGNNTRKQN